MRLEGKISELRTIFHCHAPLLIAYSGGVDSTCLLALAHRELGDRVLGIIADSPSLPRRALVEALETAQRFGARVETLKTREFDDEHYLANPLNRCYFCKAELFSQLNRIAIERGMAAIAYGENADDPADLRPGSSAAAEFRILAPLKQVGLTKVEIRTISRELDLPTHDAPAQPCLSSRIPHGTRVTPDKLALIEQAEDVVRSLGFRTFRVRYMEGPPIYARVQIAPEEMSKIAKEEDTLRAGLLSIGFAAVEIDPAGYR